MPHVLTNECSNGLVPAQFVPAPHASASLASAEAALLVALTDQARLALGNKPELPISDFPYRIGRECRSPHLLARMAKELERRIGATVQVNDVYLVEPPSAPFLQISREHCIIERLDGDYFLVDRGSACGTVVAGKRVGGYRKGDRTRLFDGDIVVLGTPESPYRFGFHIWATPLGN